MGKRTGFDGGPIELSATVQTGRGCAGEAEDLLMQSVGLVADRLAKGMREGGAFRAEGRYRVVVRVEPE